MPVYETPATFLAEALESLLAQDYPRWELCLVDDASRSPHVAEILDTYGRRDTRLRFQRLSQRGHISRATNAAIAMAQGRYVAFMDHDDRLPTHALGQVAGALRASPSSDLLYTDSDYLDGRGERCNPYFKPDWDPDLLLGQNYVTHLLVVRRSLLQAVGGLRRGYEGSQDYDLALRLAERVPPQRIQHLATPLYHWRQVPNSFGRGRLAEAARRGREAVAAHLCRQGVRARVGGVPAAPIYNRVRRPLPARPLPVTILASPAAKPGLAVLLARAGHSASSLEVLEVADARARRRALARCGRALVVLLDASFRDATEGWLPPLLAHARREEIGLVAPRLLNSVGRVGGAVWVLGLGTETATGLCAPAYSDATEVDTGYFHQLLLEHRVSALSGGCLVGRGEHLLAAELGLPEGQPRWVRDLHYSLSARAGGLACLWTPHATLRLAVSDDFPSATPRPPPAWLGQLRGDWLRRDPYYNPNFDHTRVAWALPSDSSG
jgi:hypothetical protein